MSSSAAVRTGPGQPRADGSPEPHYRDAARLTPDSLLVHAAYGQYWQGRIRREDALASWLRPTDRAGQLFVLALRLKLLGDLRPEEALELGAR